MSTTATPMAAGRLRPARPVAGRGSWLRVGRGFSRGDTGLTGVDGTGWEAGR